MEECFPVVETFSSIQGESTHAGRQCFFIRLAGCNLRCSYCDTLYAQNATDRKHFYTITDLVNQSLLAKVPVVEITGGEPMLHSGTPLLAERLLDAGLEVLIETNGSLPLHTLPEKVCRIIDVKLPSSGMSDFNDFENFSQLRGRDEIKFVTGTREDFDYALKVIDTYHLDRKSLPLLFSCVFGSLEPETLVKWILQSGKPSLRMQIQMHKVIWPPDRRGV